MNDELEAKVNAYREACRVSRDAYAAKEKADHDFNKASIASENARVALRKASDEMHDAIVGETA